MPFAPLKARAKSHGRVLLLSTALVSLSISQSHADDNALTSLGTLGGAYSNPFAISSDGSVVVGDGTNAGGADNAFRWTQTGGMVDLGTFSGGTTSAAFSVSGDGGVVVGYSDGASISGGNYHAFRWTQAGGMADLGTLGGAYSIATGASGDGSVVVGQGTIVSGDGHAFRWTQAGGMVDLGTLGGSISKAQAVSADGTVVVGQSDNSSGNYHGFRWTQAAGMTDLGTLSGGTGSAAFAISRDASVTVGYANNADGNYHAVKWAGASITDLGTLSGNDTSEAHGVSANGSVIVGESFNSPLDGSGHAFRWTQASGMQDLNTLLASAGVNMSGITLTDARGVSDDGVFIAANTDAQAYIVTLNTAAGLTTQAAQQAATQDLANRQRSMLIDSRATANELLGMNRPIDDGSYAYAGGMFGSAEGYFGGQYAYRNTEFFGGIAFGHQDYSSIKQSDVTMIALAGRHMFDDSFGDAGNALHPFVEIGGWATPSESLSLSRTYANGAGTATGEGSSDAYSLAGYARLGLAWDATPHDRLSGWGELGRQELSYDGYNESLGASNPFPASVSDGVLRYDVVKFGAALTHSLNDAALTITLSGAIVSSFDMQSDLRVNVPGVGLVQAASNNSTWGEFGAQLNARITEQLSVGAGVLGTTGGMGLGTQLHATVELTYKL